MSQSQGDSITLGILVAKHLAKADVDGTPYGPSTRPLPWAAEWEEKVNDLGLLDQSMVPNTAGPFAVGVGWKPEGDRKTKQWQGAFAALVEKAISSSGPPVTQGAGGNVPGNFSARAAFDATETDGWRPDNGTRGKLGVQDVRPPFPGQVFPKGWPGVVVPGSDLGTYQDLFLPGGGALVAPHWGGRGELGTLVYDVKNGDEIDKDRKANLQTLTRVYRRPNTCAGPLFGDVSGYSLAWQLGLARDGWGGRGTVADAPNLSGPSPGGIMTSTVQGSPQQLAAVSARLSSFLEVGHAGDKHRLGTNEDGEHMNAAHLAGKTTFFFLDSTRDAPLEFSDAPYPKTKPLAGVEVPVYLSYDQASKHGFLCGEKDGLHRWWTRSAIVPPPPPPPPPGDGPGYPGGGGPTWGWPTGPGKGSSGGGGGVLGGGSKDGEGDPFGPQTPYDPLNPDGPQPWTLDPYDPHNPANPFDPQNPYRPPLVETIEQDPARGGVVLVQSQGGVVVESTPMDRDAYGAWVQQRAQQLTTPQGGEGDDARHREACLGYAQSVNELSVPALLARPQSAHPGNKDYRNATSWGGTDAARLVNETPVAGRLEAVGLQSSTGWGPFTKTPGRGRYCGGTVDGGFMLLPPEVGVEQIYDGTVPETRSRTVIAACYSAVAYGCIDPRTGHVPNGFETLLVGDTLTTYHTSSTGERETSTPAMVLNHATQELEIYGSPVSGSSPDNFAYGGDGAAGALSFSGGAVTGASLVSTTYTLSQSLSGTSITIGAGYTVKTNGHMLVTNGHYQIDGTLDRSGGDATSTAGGAAPGGSMLLGLAGATGRTSSGNGAGGSSATAGLGGSGGNGGATSGATGGTGGAISRPASTTMPPYWTVQVPLANGRMQTLTASIDPSGGCSGGAGGFEIGASGRSGSGGASGGVLIVIAKTLTVSATGSILAKGGAAYVAAGTGDMGGGGGGGGGAIYIVTSAGGYTNSGTVSAAGGAKSNGIGAGANGTAGAAGQVFAFEL